MGNWKLPSILFDVKFFFLEKLCQLVLCTTEIRTVLLAFRERLSLIDVHNGMTVI